MTKRVEVVIIGAGTAGLSAVAEVKRVTDDFLLVNQGPYGTTCARVACMPTKTLCEVAAVFHSRRIMAGMGVTGVENLGLESKDALAYVKDLRDRFVAGTVKGTKALGEKSINAPARFIEPTVLRIGGDTVEAGRVVIATGSSPIIPAGWENLGGLVVTTDQFFELDQLPRRMAVIGLGPSGIEFSQALSRLGIEVHGFHLADMAAGLTDPEVNAAALAALREEYSINLGTEVDPLRQGEELLLQSRDQRVMVEKALLCTGRRPNLSGLGLEELDLETDAHGVPVFDRESMRIGDSPIFIAGDVNNERAILHEANDEGHIAGYNAARREANCFRRRTPLAIVYSDPQIAMVGASFAELSDSDMVVGEYDFGRQGRARMRAENRGIARIYLDKNDGRLLGGEMAAPGGEHLAHLLAWAIQENLTVFDILRFPYYHPTVEEGLQSALRNGMKKLSCERPELEILLCRSSSLEPLC
ncbi:MAG: dihydrolipoyl dehydrogenase [Desulfurivibrionaceae bacterium]